MYHEYHYLPKWLLFRYTQQSSKSYFVTYGLSASINIVYWHANQFFLVISVQIANVIQTPQQKLPLIEFFSNLKNMWLL